MLAISFGLGFLLASIAASFIIRANKKTFFRTLRETNAAWRAYEQDTVKLYHLSSTADSLFYLTTLIIQVLKTEEETEDNKEACRRLAFLYSANFAEELGGNGFNTTALAGLTVEEFPQHISDLKTKIREQLQAIYDEHNKDGLLQRKER